MLLRFHLTRILKDVTDLEIPVLSRYLVAGETEDRLSSCCQPFSNFVFCLAAEVWIRSIEDWRIVWLTTSERRTDHLVEIGWKRMEK